MQLNAKLGIYYFFINSGLCSNQHTALFSAGLPYVQTGKTPKGLSISIRAPGN